ncbi:MAG: HU family DNA-binding protein [Acidobacteriota bacterium]
MAGKAEIIERVVGDVEGMTKKQAGDAFDVIFGAITDQLSDGERVSIHAFGSFSVAERAERQGRNPATGATITIPASKNVKFKPAKDLKASVND